MNPRVVNIADRVAFEHRKTLLKPKRNRAPLIFVLVTLSCWAAIGFGVWWISKLVER